MSDTKTEMQKHGALRLSNEESNRLTRECIQTALVILMGEKDLDSITVSEVVRRAGVSRGAFYRNYRSKEDVLDEYAAERLSAFDALAWEAIDARDARSLYRRLFARVRDDPGEFGILVRAGILVRDAADVRAFLAEGYASSPAATRYLLLGWFGMLRNIVLEWYLDGMVGDVDEMAELCVRASEGMVALMRNVDPRFVPPTGPQPNGEG